MCCTVLCIHIQKAPATTLLSIDGTGSSLWRSSTVPYWKHDGSCICAMLSATAIFVMCQSVQSLSHVQLFATPWTATLQAPLSITNSRSLLKLVSIKLGDAIQPSHPLLSPSPLTFILSKHQGLLQGVSSSHQVAKVLEFQLQHQSFQ